MEISREAIAKRIKMIRKRLDVSQREFAERFNKRKPHNITTTREDVSNYEQARCELPTTKWLKFLRMEKK